MKTILVSQTSPENDLSIEEFIINCARVSNPENRLNHDTAPKLLAYLIKHKHWSPFETISFGFEIQTSRAIAQQLIRHRSMAVQEFSQRYSTVTDLEPVELRYKESTNRQSSKDISSDTTLADAVTSSQKQARELYNRLLDDGIAPECARMVLPLSTQTTVIMTGSLRSWIHFFDQRCSEHAQKEIRLIAVEIRGKLASILPWTATALDW